MPRLAAATCLVTLFALGCQKDDIRSFPAPKEQTNEGGMAQTRPSGAMEGLDWTLPEGWTELPGEGMRYATLRIDTSSGEAPLEVRVTPLALGAKDPLANVNRWREQIGLEHVGPDQLSDVARSVEIDGRPAHLVDMTGTAVGDAPPQRILAAILPGEQRAWFFLIMEDAERVAPVASQFETFMRSVTLRTETPPSDLPPGHPPLEGTESASPSPGMSPPSGAPQDLPLRWTTPEGWSERQETNPSRLATLDVVQGGHQAEVTITRFPGDVGGMLPNVNRWRGQLGLDPIQDLSSLERPLEILEVDGSTAQLLDLVGLATDGDPAPRMLVALVPQPSFTYFVKMTGPETLLGEQRDTFVTFARSLRFEAPHP
jgi:hypothetical protein